MQRHVSPRSVPRRRGRRRGGSNRPELQGQRLPASTRGTPRPVARLRLRNHKVREGCTPADKGPRRHAAEQRRRLVSCSCSRSQHGNTDGQGAEGRGLGASGVVDACVEVWTRIAGGVH